MSLHDNAMLLWAQDPINNEFQDAAAIAQMYSHFNGGMENPLPPLQNDDRPHVILIFEKAGEHSHATLLHHMKRFPARMGSPTTYDGNWYATSGQPIGGHHITVAVPEDLFQSGAPVQTYLATHMQLELGNDPDLEQIIPEITEANIEDLDLITNRYGMWIPYQYAVLVMEEGLTPGEVWTCIYSAILQNGHLEACAMLIQFLQVQLLGTGPSNSYLFGTVALELSQPISTLVLILHRNAILSHMVSTAVPVNPPAPGIMPGMTALDFQVLVVALSSGHATTAPAASGSRTLQFRSVGMSMARHS